MTKENPAIGGLRLVTVSTLPGKTGYEWLTAPALRHLVFQAESRQDSKGRIVPGNGLAEAGAIIRIGRKVLIDLDRFDNWLDSHRTQDGGH